MMSQTAKTSTSLSLNFDSLSQKLRGELHWDDTMRTLYATDASAYREMPVAVAIPKDVEDLKSLLAFSQEQQVPLIPRAAGTSLAGQVVGQGIVVDISVHFGQIVEVNPEESWVKVQPGVIRDELNRFLQPQGLFFGPETSTANRAMVGGMVGNNSCGSNSVVYGSTRDHLLEVKALLSDGSEVIFGPLSPAEYLAKTKQEDLEGSIYREMQALLARAENQAEILKEFPKPSIPRRNTGYALDLLLDNEVFGSSQEAFNFCKLIAGSEGTLCFITEVKLSVSPLPPPEVGLVCAHFETVRDALQANLIALKYKPSACELMDHFILECTKSNIEQRRNRFFVEGDPGAILVVELRRESREEIENLASAMEKEMRAGGLGYHFPVVWGEDSKKVWTLRKAGLGLLSNIPGDAKPAPVIEDTAVAVEELPDYIDAFNLILQKHEMECVHYAHAGSGELHLRPILNLKTEEGNQQFRLIAEEIARLVKKYKGSLSGEHGDGRLRGEFLEEMIGAKNYQLVKRVKEIFDPHHRLNPNKIVDTPPMDTHLRYTPGQPTPEPKTWFDFSYYKGYVRAAEMCNGSGDCRKMALSGGTMCPSYMATRNEKHTTRARANIIREVFTQETSQDPFEREEVLEVMDLCLSCKACKSECPSNVDVAKLKAEYLQHMYDKQGVPLRTRLIANFSKLNRLASRVSGLYNAFFKMPVLGPLSKSWMGFAPERSMPPLHKQTLSQWYKQYKSSMKAQKYPLGKVYLFNDEFTNYNDTPIGIKAVQLLEALGYEVIIPKHEESGRTFLSKGLVRQARDIAQKNVQTFSCMVSDQTPLIGLEPSAILTFRDEYVELLRGAEKKQAEYTAQHTYLLDEFLAREIDRGNIQADQFTQESRLIKMHGHCYQKALASLTPSKKMLSLPQNYEVHLIPSGCCGMAGSFGYEKEHFDISMQIGELVLFPAVRDLEPEVLVAAAGTSCRHQIKDGTGKIALHPVEIWWEALLDKA